MATLPKYRILIIDDNPFPTRECCGILLEKLQNHFGKPFDHTLQEYYYNDYSDLQNEYSEIKGKDFHFVLEEEISISIYNYNPFDSKEINQNKIIKIIKDREINIFWTDRGHTNFRINGGEMFEETNGHPAKADELYLNKNIVQQLKTNGIRQIAMYSYNPKFTYTAIDNKVEEIGKIFQGELSKDDIYVLETSPILNLFSPEDKLYNGLPDTKLLGSLNAYKYYGKLLGSVFFDLFLQIKENKAKLSDKQKRYNFFNRYNRNFLRYFKLLNSDLINKFNDFKIGMVSFYGNIYGQEHFLIDVPYKEYYEKYDKELHKGNPPIGTIINPIDTDDNLDSKKWLYFKYKKDSYGQFTGCYELEDSIKSRGHLVEGYLPLLHTGVFYEPDFYENANFPFDRFKITTKDDFCLDAGNSCVEIIYLFKKVSFEGIQGVSHFVVWKRVSPESESINLKETIEEIWENYYRLVEPKLEAALVTILQIETAKQATKSAISQVMARNSSHNIGSHVMNKLINGKSLKNLNPRQFQPLGIPNNYSSEITFEELTNDSDPFQQIAIFNKYVKCRMDYLSDITFGTPLMQTTKYVYSDLFKDLDKVRLLLENISGLSKFPYSIQFTEDGQPINSDSVFSLALPNDILGSQALYNIIENTIRNSAKHSKDKPEKINFIINFRVIKEEDAINNGNSYLQNDANDYYVVEIFDNINVVGDKVFSKDEDEDEYLKKVFRKAKAQSEFKKSISNIDYLIFRQNERLNGSILQENNSLRASGLGLIEMEASACYLRKLDISNIESDLFNVDHSSKIFNDFNQLNIIKAFKKSVFKDGINENYLAYRFFMLRPAEVLIITNQQLKEVDINHWSKLGVYILSSEKFIEQLNSNRVFNHQFVIYDNSDIYKTILSYKTYLPIRHIFISNINSLFTSNEFKDLEETIWRKWEVELKSAEYFNYTEFLISNSEISDIDYDKREVLTIIYDHIGEEESNKQSNIGAKLSIEKLDTNYLADALSSIAQEKLPDFGVLSKDLGYTGKQLKNYLEKISLNYRESNYCTYLKVCESYLFKVLVIDERIQGNLNEDYLSIKYNVLYEKSNIIVPTVTDINLSGLEIDKDDLISKLNTYLRKLSKHDFVLIHYSILERAFSNVETDIRNYLSDLGKNYNVIITSGRGTPKGLPLNVRFVNLSSVINAFIEIRSKYLVNYLLHSARKSS